MTSRHVGIARQRQEAEIRGAVTAVQVFHGAGIVAEHARGTDCRVVIDRRQHESGATATAVPPMPLGRLGTILERLGEMAVDA